MSVGGVRVRERKKQVPRLSSPRKLGACGMTNSKRKAGDWYTNPKTKKSQPVPRHNEIHEQLAKSIIRKLSKAEQE